MRESDALIEALDRLLEPLVRILVRNGIPHAAFAELAKRAYVRVAQREEGIHGRKQTVSRMSVLTGLTRKEVSRILKLPSKASGDEAIRYHRASRVITGWIRDERFLDATGEPRDLALDGEGDTFAGLVKAYSGDVPPRAILDELERVGAVARDGASVRLLERAYLPRAGEADKLQILGTDVAGLISTIRHNLDAQPATAFYQRKVFYDQLPLACLPELRGLAAHKGQELLELLDAWMSSRDIEVNPTSAGDAAGPIGRAGIGVYYFEEDEEEEHP